MTNIRYDNGNWQAVLNTTTMLPECDWKLLEDAVRKGRQAARTGTPPDQIPTSSRRVADLVADWTASWPMDLHEWFFAGPCNFVLPVLEDLLRAQGVVTVLYTTANDRYDYGYVRTIEQFECERKVWRKIEVWGKDSEERDYRVGYQSLRYGSGLHPATPEDPRVLQAALDARRAVWAEEARERAELEAWALQADRTEDEIKARRDDFDRLGLIWNGYVKGLYFRRLDEIKARDKASAIRAEVDAEAAVFAHPDDVVALRKIAADKTVYYELMGRPLGWESLESFRGVRTVRGFVESGMSYRVRDSTPDAVIKATGGKSQQGDWYNGRIKARCLQGEMLYGFEIPYRYGEWVVYRGDGSKVAKNTKLHAEFVRRATRKLPPPPPPPPPPPRRIG